jgi:hypothetical protein
VAHRPAPRSALQSNQGSMDARVLFDHLGQPAESELTFHDRIPFGAEILRHGGIPGIEYCWVLPENIDKFESAAPDEDGFAWSRVADWKWPIHITGPRGTVRRCQLYGRGTPIIGASPHSGLRRWHCDNDILKRTGIAWPSFLGRDRTEAEKQVEADRVKDTGKLPAGRPTNESRYVQAAAEKVNRAAGA